MLKKKSFCLSLILIGWTVMNGCGDGTSEETSEVKSICGRTEDFFPINNYRGSLPYVQTREEAVGRLNRSCSGTYIGAAGPYRHLFLTAGHCGREGAYAAVDFNYEYNADGPVKRVTGRFIESSRSPDYALIQLDSNPGVAPTPLSTTMTSNVTIIQHPATRPKSVAFGSLVRSASSSRIYYSGLDTLGGSSGSGILNSNGYLVGVHTLGGCSTRGGTNSGWTISSIRAASRIL